MKKLEKKLSTWMEHGLITDQQSQMIVEFEESRSSNRNWALWGAVSVGISAIVIGLISIVAANWDSIGDNVKLTAYFVLQGTIGGFAFRQLGKPGLVREALLTSFALLFLAGIGLIGQVFHLESNGYSALFFWCGLTGLINFLTEKRFFSYLWVVALMIALSIYSFDIADSLQDHAELTRHCWLVGISVYGLFALGIFSRDKIKLPDYLAEALVILFFLSIFIGMSVLGTGFWYINMQRELRQISNDEIIILTLRWLPYVGAGLISAALLTRKPALDTKVCYSLVALFFLLAGFVSTPIMFTTPRLELVGTIFSIIVWAVAGLAAVYANKKRLFDIITLCITIRLLIVYFEVFGSLMQTGVGLIISGVFILCAVFVWFRCRNMLANLIRKTA